MDWQSFDSVRMVFAETYDANELCVTAEAVSKHRSTERNLQWFFWTKVKTTWSPGLAEMASGANCKPPCPTWTLWISAKERVASRRRRKESNIVNDEWRTVKERNKVRSALCFTWSHFMLATNWHVTFVGNDGLYIAANQAVTNQSLGFTPLLI